MTREELERRRSLRTAMDAAANSWDPEEHARLSKIVRDLRNLSIPMQVTEDAAEVIETLAHLKE